MKMFINLFTKFYLISLIVVGLRAVSMDQTALLNCDDGIHGIGIDWDGADDKINPTKYQCDKQLSPIKFSFIYSQSYDSKIGYHQCISQPIVYDDPVPISGTHRPVWPTYGEYTYLPPQRWVHSLEHGAIAMIYDPCADQNEIALLKSIVKKCLKRYVITPYKQLPSNEPLTEIFNLLSAKSKLKFNKVSGNENVIRQFIKDHAIVDGPEKIYIDGSYRFGLLEQSKIVSDPFDSIICPA